MRLLNARAACALEIGRVKKHAGLPIYQPSREAEVLGHVQEINPGPLDDGAVRRLFERIIDEARRLERIAEDGDDVTKSDTEPAGGEPMNGTATVHMSESSEDRREPVSCASS